MSPQQPRHVLRSLLRLVKTPVLPKELLQKHVSAQDAHNGSIQRLVLQEYRSSQHNSRQRTRLACRYQELLDNLKARQALYDLDRGAEDRFTPKELSRRAAARAGLQLPDTSNVEY